MPKLPLETMKRRVGRPRKQADGHAMTVGVYLRFTPEAWQQIEEAAKKDQHHPADWMRRVIEKALAGA